VFFFWSNIREDDLVMTEASLASLFENILFTSTREPKEPEDRIWNSFQNINPDIKHCRINLIELIEATKDKFILSGEREERVRGETERSQSVVDLFNSILCSPKGPLVVEEKTS
jgi:hypothetical protein